MNHPSMEAIMFLLNVESDDIILSGLIYHESVSTLTYK
jgi:hypothetical protein